jgi:hypothetical protein
VENTRQTAFLQVNRAYENTPQFGLTRLLAFSWGHDSLVDLRAVFSIRQLMHRQASGLHFNHRAARTILKRNHRRFCAVSRIWQTVKEVARRNATEWRNFVNLRGRATTSSTHMLV